MVTDHSAAEQKLWSDAELNLPIDFSVVQNGDIRANVLRDLLLKLDKASAPELSVRGARIDGVLDLTGITVRTALLLKECTMKDVIKLIDAELPRVVLSRCELRGLRADGLTVAKGLNARHMVCVGPVRLCGATVGGQLDLAGATLTSTEGPALFADGLRVSGDLLLESLGEPDEDGFQPFVARGTGDGAVRLLGAEIAGNLSCDKAAVANARGPALQAERVNVGGSILLREAVCEGTITLHGASVQSRLNCEQATITGRNGPALQADGLRTGGDVVLSGVDATGDGAEAVVSLPGAQIGGSLLCDGGVITADGSGALDLSFVSLGRLLSLHPGFAAGGWVHLDGLDYPAVPRGMDRDEWTCFLRDRVVYATQPYQQLAAAYRAAGRDEDARAVLIAQRDHLRQRPHLPRRTRAWLTLLKLTLGYGYQSWRALVALAITLVCAVAFVLAADKITHTVKSPTTGRSCQAVDRVGLGVELAVPVVKVAARSRCDLIPSTRIDALAVAGGWAFQCLGWAFATLFVAGYSGLVRKG